MTPQEQLRSLLVVRKPLFRGCAGDEFIWRQPPWIPIFILKGKVDDVEP
jgi:hypothetical protein